jgi:hypothetical protein
LIARDSNVAGVANFNDLPVFDSLVAGNGYAGKITPTFNTVGWYTFTMAANGNHLIEVQTGQGAVSGSAFVGAGHILAVAGTNVQLAPLTSVPRRMLFVGDSEVPANTGTSALGVTDLLALLRSIYPGRLTIEAMGVATYTMWSDVPSIMARYARHTADASIFDIVYLLGTNDYGAGLGDLTAQCTTLFANLVTLPRLNKLCIVTPITRGTETAVGGFTLGQRRSQITAAAQAANSPKIVIVDGSNLGLNTSVDYQETPAANALHPNDTGSQKIMVGIRQGLQF